MHSSSATRASAEQTEVEQLLFGVDVPSGIGAAATPFAQRKQQEAMEKIFCGGGCVAKGFVPLKH